MSKPTLHSTSTPANPHAFAETDGNLIVLNRIVARTLPEQPCPQTAVVSQPTGWRLLWTTGLVLSLFLSGCSEKKETSPEAAQTPPGEPLRLVVVDDPQYAQAIDRLWNAVDETGVQTTSISLAEFQADTYQAALDCDVLIYPSSELGDLIAAQRIMTLRPQMLEDDEFNSRDILPLEGQLRGRWGDATYAVSLGHRPWILAYREDIFAALDLEAPETWEEYQLICERLKSPPELDLPIIADDWTATSEPTADDSLARLFLARSAAYVRHRGSYSGLFDLRQQAASLDQDGFRRGLRELIQVHHSFDPVRRSAQECWIRLREGRCAMIVCAPESWPVLDSSGKPLASGSTETSSLPVTVSPLPGAREVFVTASGQWRAREPDETKQVPFLDQQGRLVSLSATTSRIGSSWGLIKWISDTPQQNQLGPTSPAAFPSRHSTLASLDRWLPAELGPQAASRLNSLIDDEQTQLVYLLTPRIPGHRQLMQELTTGLETALSGGDPAETLGAVEQAWNARIDKTGAETFMQQAEESLGID